MIRVLPIGLARVRFTSRKRDVEAPCLHCVTTPYPLAKYKDKELKMIGRLNHVAIAVPDLKTAAEQYRNTLGAQVGEPQDEPDHGVTVVFIELPNTKIELLYPLGDNSPIRGFLEKNPSGGIHHVCYEVEDILAARDQLKANGASNQREGEPKKEEQLSPEL